MMDKLIQWSIGNRALVLLVALFDVEYSRTIRQSATDVVTVGHTPDVSLTASTAPALAFLPAWRRARARDRLERRAERSSC